MFLDYLYVFLVGGVVCLIGQILINKTHITSARILVVFLLLGGLLEWTGAFEPIKEFGGAGITVPITGFGSNLVKGALKGAQESGFLGALKGGMTAVSGALTVSIVVGFIIALIFRARTKA